MRKPPKPPPSAADAVCLRWFGIQFNHAMRIVVGGFLAGAGMEAFMIKGWIGKTNFYETVKKKEAEKRLANATPDAAADEPNFGDILKQQWEEKMRQLEEENKKAAAAGGTKS